MTLKYGFGMGRNESITEVVPQVQLAEALGYEHATFIDSQNLSRDSVSMMTLAAINTTRIRIGQGVTQPYTRHPAVMSNAVATINELSGGRAFLGIGAGGSSLGVIGKQPRSMATLEETVKFFRDFTSGEKFTWQGAEVHSEWSTQKRIPVILGVDGPKAIRMAGRIADGVFLPGLRTEMIEWKRKRLAEGAEAVGKILSDIEAWTRTMVFVDEDAAFAKEEVRSYACTCAYFYWLAIFRWKTDDAKELMDALPGSLVDEIMKLGETYDWYQHEQRSASFAADASDELVDAFTIAGPPTKCREMIQHLKSDGVDRVSMVLYTINDKKRALRRFAEDVYPYVR